MNHFLPPGVAYTTGLSHNPFTWLPLQDGKNITPKSGAIYSYVKSLRHLPVKRPVFPTIPLLYAKDQCEALSKGEIGYEWLALYRQRLVFTYKTKDAG